MGKRKNELMVGTLPNVADFIREMAADKQAILAKAAQKKAPVTSFLWLRRVITRLISMLK